MRRALDWFFRDRTTGAITVGQWPNAPLLAFGALALVDWLLAPTGDAGTVVRALGSASLGVWAADELARGVNPWRRCLGAAVLVGLIASWSRARA